VTTGIIDEYCMALYGPLLVRTGGEIMATIKKPKGTQTLETADEEAPLDFTNMTAEEKKAETKKTNAKTKALMERIKEERLAKKKEPK